VDFPALICLLIFIASSPASYSEEKQLLSFADHLFDEGDYYRAITEYERFLFNFPENTDAPRARIKIGLAYQRGQKWRQAEDELGAVIRDYKGSPYERQAAWELGETYYKSGQFTRAASQYKYFRESFPEESLASKAQMRIAWCSARTGDYQTVRKELSLVENSSPYHEPAQGFLKDLAGFDSLGRKSPALSGAMSAVIPGTGQFYAGRYMDGMAALIINAAFIYGAVEAYNNKIYGAFGILLFFETGWYGGNILSAITSAHKYNRDQQEIFLRTLENKYWEP